MKPSWATLEEISGPVKKEIQQLDDQKFP
jgi:hypothetical protein